jgi:uncharacterized protein (TIGR02449 family)
MDSLYHQLEQRIKTLIQEYTQLKQDYALALIKQAQVEQDKEQLLTKHKLAISHIENMVSELKLLEASQ